MAHGGLQGELSDVIRRVAGRAASRERLDAQAIHEMRKALKRARAGLRLVRDAVPGKEYEVENARLRDAARPLGAARDAVVLLGVVNELPRTQPLSALRDHLAEESRSLGAGMQAPQLRKAVADPLHDALARIERWRLPPDLRPVLARGLKRLYRKAHKAAKEARKDGSDEALHEARKQAKYVANALDILGAKKRLGKQAKAVDRLGKRLGDDHDLAMLLARLGEARDDSDALKKLQRRRRKLQRNAWKRAKQAYRRKAKRVLARAL